MNNRHSMGWKLFFIVVVPVWTFKFASLIFYANKGINGNHIHHYKDDYPKSNSTNIKN